MPWSFAAAAMSVIGTVIQYSAQEQAADAARAQGIAQQQAADYQAKTMEIRAGQERAAAQRQAIEQRRREQLVQSRAQALAAASGAGASDPTVISNDERTTREGELNALTALYQGEQSAQGLEGGAGLKRYEGDSEAFGANAKADAMDTAATAGLFSGLGKTASMFGKYGPSDASDAYAAGQDQLPFARNNISTGVSGTSPY